MSSDLRAAQPPEVTLYPRGAIRLNRAAAQALGADKVDLRLSVRLTWNRQQRTLTISAGPGDHCVRIYRKSRNALLFQILAIRFFKSSIGLRVPASRRFPARLEGPGTLVIAREGPSTKVSRPRSSR